MQIIISMLVGVWFITLLGGLILPYTKLLKSKKLTKREVKIIYNMLIFISVISLMEAFIAYLVLA